MKKSIRTTFFMLLFSVGLQAQFVDLDPTREPQKGCILIGDIDNDGDLDLLYNGFNLLPENKHASVNGILINDGTGNFSRQQSTNVIATGHLTQMQFGDIDGDGDLDVIFNGTPAEGLSTFVGIALNDGNGVYSIGDPNVYPVIADSYVSCGFADFDNNGLLDYYLFGNDIGRNAICFQQKNGTFVVDKSSFANDFFVDPHVTVVDFNNDGYMDIWLEAWKEAPIAAGESKGRYCKMYKNDGFGHFAVYQQPNIIPKSYGSSFWNDFDGDGYMDLIMNGDGWVNTTENSDGIVRVYKNQTGILTPKTTFDWYRQLSVAGGSLFVDWDNDGDLDVFTGGWSDNAGRQKTALFLCTDPLAYQFTESALSNTYFPGVSENSYALGDLNSDGKVDIAIMGYNGNQSTNPVQLGRNIIGWCPNNDSAIPVYTKPNAPTALTELIAGTGIERMVKFSWTPPVSENSKKGTTYNLALKNTTTGKWFYNPMAVIEGAKNGWRKVVGTGNVGTNLSWELYDLPDGNYQWTVQAINGAYFGGTFAGVRNFTLGTSALSTPKDYGIQISTAYNQLSVSSKNNDLLSITIFSVDGKLLNAVKDIDKAKFQLKQGLYIIRIDNGKQTFTEKISLY